MEIIKNKPVLILIAGLPASGKTWLARALAADLDGVHINSDFVRAALGLRGHYDPASKQRVYDAMFGQGERAIMQGKTVVVDSTFYNRALRRPWVDLAEKWDVSCHFIELKIPDEVAFLRLQKKREDSEATWEVYQKLKAQWEAIEEPHLTLDPDGLSFVDMKEEVKRFLSKNP